MRVGALAAAVSSVVAACTAMAGDVQRDVAYVENGHAEQHLDMYWPDVAPAKAVLFVHGGSLTESGERRASPMYADICARLAASGLACATADYRLSPSFQWPAMPEDIAAALRTARMLLEARGGDPQQVFLFGHSSGCHLVAILATNPAYLTTVGLAPSDLAGIICMGCTLDKSDAALRGKTADDLRPVLEKLGSSVDLYGSAENWIAANPAHHLGPHVPPTLVVVAQRERFFPSILEQGARFVRLLLEADVPANLVIVPGSHKSSIADFGKPGDVTFDAVLSFIADPASVARE